jgi:thiamine kinase-like enzyme
MPKLLPQTGSTLTESDVIPYLLARELISASSVVSGELRVVDASRRNRNFRVVRSDGPSYLLKQGVMRDGYSAIAREARAYQLIAALRNSCDVNAPTFRHAPRAYGYDEERDVLIVEFLTGAETLRSRHRRARRPPRATAQAVGKALARLHELVPTAVNLVTAEQLLGPCEPDVLSVQRPGVVMLRDFSNASIELVRMIQAVPEVGALLDDVRRGWRSDALIHHDLRWDNILLPYGMRANGGDIKFVDWETAALGDSGWDVGSVFGEYLGHWLSSIPGAGQEPPERYLCLARRPLDSVQPAIRSFWLSYVRESALTENEAKTFLFRATRYSGLKLIQSALEQVSHSPWWTISSIGFLQVGINILTDPKQAIVTLLGLGEMA